MTSNRGDGHYAASSLIRQARVVPVDGGAAGSTADRGHDGPVDIRIVNGTITQVARTLVPDAGEVVFEAGGRWAVPGLWDQHVHMGEWAQTSIRLDVGGTSSPDEVVRIVGDHVASLGADRAGRVVLGGGFRSATWSEDPTVSALDAVSGDHPVVLVSGDAHTGWLNSEALRLLGAPPRASVLTENAWFALATRIDELPGARDGQDTAYRRAVEDAASRGVVGVRDLDLRPSYREWPQRFAHGIDKLRVRTAVYPEHLDDVIAAGLRTGDALSGGAGLLRMGPLKVIGDGSLNTRTAFCCEPYADATGTDHPRGAPNVTSAELTSLLRRAHGAGLDVAVHAIGDAMVGATLDAFAATGAGGTLEHAQLIRLGDVHRMAALGVAASVQPAHLLDDRDVTAQCWPDRTGRCFLFASMLRAGVTLILGSDAPVAPLSPWLAMAAAVHRSGDDRPPWNAEESMTPRQALAASVDGQGTIAPGGRGDVVLLDTDPLDPSEDPAQAAKRLRDMRVAATILAGRATYLEL